MKVLISLREMRSLTRSVRSTFQAEDTTMFKNDDHVLDHVDDYLHEVLSAADAAYVERHCEKCRVCQAALEEAQKRFRALRSVPVCEASEPLIQATVAGIAEYDAARKRRRRRFVSGTLAAIAASVAIIGSAHIYFANLRASPYDLRVIGQTEWLAGSEGALRVQMFDRERGNPIAGVPVDIVVSRQQKAREDFKLASFTTNDSGSGHVRFRLPDWNDNNCELRVVARPSGDTETVVRPVKLKRSWKLMLSNDKPVYQPGQMILMRALAVRRPDLQPVGEEDITFSISDPRGNIVFKRQVKTSKFGIASAECPLATELIEGPHTLICKIGDTESRKTVQVHKYVLPKFKVDIALDQPFYQPGQTIKGTVQADYFFGKPVGNAEVRVDIQSSDHRLQTIVNLAVRTDATGKAMFLFPLPALTGREQLSGDAQVTFNVGVTDAAGQQFSKSTSRTVTNQLIRVEAIPEGGALVSNVPNRVFLFATYPDGRPVARAQFRVAGVGEATANDLGVAILEILPEELRVSWRIVATDAKGRKGQRDIALSTAPTFDFIIRTNKSVYDGGETVTLAVFGGGSGTVYVDFVKDGQTALTDTFDIKDGRGEYQLDLPADLFGTVELYAYHFGSEGLPVRKSRVLFIRSARQVGIKTTLDQAEYRPGGKAKLKFALTDADGKPLPGALSLAAVDEAVFSVLDSAPGMEKTFYLLEQQLLQPIYSLYAWSPEMRDAIPPDDLNNFEQALFARTARTDGASEFAFQAGGVGRKPAMAPVGPQRPGGLPYTLAASSYVSKVADTAAWRTRGLRWVENAWKWMGGTVACLAVLSLGIVLAYYSRLLLAAYLLGGALASAAIVVNIFGVEAKHTFGAGGARMGADKGMPMDMAPRTADRRPMPMAEPAERSKDGGDAPTVRVRESFPETLLWRPEIITDDQGQATLEVELADSITTWRLATSAISADGRLGAAQAPIKVFQPFFVDLYLPPTLTRGDEVTIPVVVYNYLDKPQTVALTLDDADWFERTGGGAQQIELAANEVRSLAYRIRVTRVGNHHLQVTARGQGVADAIKREIEVVPDGKKFEEVVTDRLKGDIAQTITIPENSVADSYKLLVKVYPGIFSQVLEGTEGMLRLPGG